MPVPPLAPRPAEPGEAAGVKLGIEEPKRAVPTSPEQAAIKEQPASEHASPPAALRAAKATTAELKRWDDSRLGHPAYPNRAYALAYLALFAGGALFATGRAFATGRSGGSRLSGFAR